MVVGKVGLPAANILVFKGYVLIRPVDIHDIALEAVGVVVLRHTLGQVFGAGLLCLGQYRLHLLWIILDALHGISEAAVGEVYAVQSVSVVFVPVVGEVEGAVYEQTVLPRIIEVVIRHFIGQLIVIHFGLVFLHEGLGIGFIPLVHDQKLAVPLVLGAEVVTVQSGIAGLVEGQESVEQEQEREGDAEEFVTDELFQFVFQHGFTLFLSRFGFAGLYDLTRFGVDDG